MNGCPSAITNLAGEDVEGSAGPEVPIPIAFCPAETASPGESLPWANRTSCAVSSASQSQQYVRA
ncbi:hypothetical protein [Streptomyces auratus]|nr:hypothetical protein [Streptomyces auratus]QTZ94561.1 hypothetical protein SU9_026495 [Streptomyces auratus AGR0001]